MSRQYKTLLKKLFPKNSLVIYHCKARQNYYYHYQKIIRVIRRKAFQNIYWFKSKFDVTFIPDSKIYLLVQNNSANEHFLSDNPSIIHGLTINLSICKKTISNHKKR